MPNCIDYATLTVSSSAVTLLTDASPALNGNSVPALLRAKGAKIISEDEQVRYRIDGTAPTATEGTILNANEELVFDSWTVPKQNWRSVLSAIQFIRTVNDAKLKIHYFD